MSFRRMIPSGKLIERIWVHAVTKMINTKYFSFLTHMFSPIAFITKASAQRFALAKHSSGADVDSVCELETRKIIDAEPPAVW